MIKGRDSLKSLFTDGTIPTSADFSDLIESVLNNRDDKFFGQWRPGIAYQKDDIVIYQKVFYTFLSVEAAKLLDPNCNCGDDCCNDQTPKDCCRWQQLQLAVDDDDWVVCDDDTTMYAKVFGKVGIGTGCDPSAFFHLLDANNNSQLKFNPLEEGIEYPMLKMIKGLTQTGHVAPETEADDDDEAAGQRNFGAPPPGSTLFFSQQMEGFIPAAKSKVHYRVTHKTDTLGYLFKRAFHSGGHAHDDMALLFVTSNHERPRVGIGTTNPQSTLDLTEHGKGKILLEPGERMDPEIVLINLKPADAQNYFRFKVGTTKTTFETDARDGFVFRRGVDFPAGHQRHQERHTENRAGLVAIDLDGDLRARGLFVDPVVDHDRSQRRHRPEAIKILNDLEPHWHGDVSGFSAENINDVIPHSYKKFADNTEGIGYHDLVVLLVKAVQELSAEVERLKNKHKTSD